MALTNLGQAPVAPVLDDVAQISPPVVPAIDWGELYYAVTETQLKVVVRNSETVINICKCQVPVEGA